MSARIFYCKNAFNCKSMKIIKIIFEVNKVPNSIWLEIVVFSIIEIRHVAYVVVNRLLLFFHKFAITYYNKIFFFCLTFAHTYLLLNISKI